MTIRQTYITRFEAYDPHISVFGSDAYSFLLADKPDLFLVDYRMVSPYFDKQYARFQTAPVNDCNSDLVYKEITMILFGIEEEEKYNDNNNT